MPDRNFTALLASFQRSCRSRATAHAVIVSAAVAALTAVIAGLTSVSAQVVQIASSSAFLVCLSALVHIWRRQWTLARTAQMLERSSAGLDNLVITAEEVVRGKAAAVHSVVRRGLIDAAAARLHQHTPGALVPTAVMVTAATGSVVALTALLVTMPSMALSGPLRPPWSESAAPRLPARGDIAVTVTPPSYSGRRVVEVTNPESIDVLEGSRVRITASTEAGEVMVIAEDGSRAPFQFARGTLQHELLATTSRALIVRHQGGVDGNRDRLLQLRVKVDAPPVVRIKAPAKDLAFPEARGEVALQLESSDDVGLSSLSLRYTRVSGSGESFTFEEGELPLRVRAEHPDRWTADGVISLSALELQDGDTVVYRALATDRKPGSDPATSDTFLIEIGRLSGLASTGFALPDERDRQAISQQMLIIKTERLHATRNQLAVEALTEQARLLAIEQRMVKAEFVFMTGGEVEDEVEEAAHGHELAEGRLENAAQIELLTAIREMSRAEARLNDGDTADALTFERSALRALQRAFDRRRYLLRTLPERTRIDLTRRLSGELDAARSSAAAAALTEDDPVVVRARGLVADLMAADSSAASLTLLASRMLAIDASAESLQAAAAALATAREPEARRTAARRAQAALLATVAARLPRGTSTGIERTPLWGRWAEEARPSGVPR